ncbi:MAG TPA: D-alanyl-D-alanine carboxypeptidase, partial [Puia sp.]|nr:D-alanyl-D-alanine carboxypeptidase [Puia sp.]
MKHCILWLFAALSIFSACFPGKRIDKQARADLFRPKGLENALIGVQVFDANSGLVLYGHQDENYFVPASNTKLFSLYAGLKYLGDSIVGMRYMETDSGILVLPSGDPTLLHRDYAWQPVI